jgi:hypothetical protein
MAIDQTERRACFGMAGLGGLFSLYLLYVVVFVGEEKSTVSVAITKAKECPVGYHANALLTKCLQVQITDIAQLWYTFGVVSVCSLLLGLFAWRRRRTGSVFFSLFEGLALGAVGVGIPFVLLGVWMGWRAWRLQKYGVATFAGVSKIKRDQQVARKEGRPPPPLPVAEIVAKPIVIDPEQPRTLAEPSKRYTPKKAPKKR